MHGTRLSWPGSEARASFPSLSMDDKTSTPGEVPAPCRGFSPRFRGALQPEASRNLNQDPSKEKGEGKRKEGKERERGREGQPHDPPPAEGSQWGNA